MGFAHGFVCSQQYNRLSRYPDWTESMNITQRNLSGKHYLTAVTTLLQRIRLQGPFAGLYEAADLQWRWRLDDAAIAERQIFWFDGRGQPIACFLRQDAGEEWNFDFIYLPSASDGVETQILPHVLVELGNADRPATLAVSEHDGLLRRAVETLGYEQTENTLILTELEQDPAGIPLPPGFSLGSRVEEERPHHLIPRNGIHVATRLGECSLYRPELDLCIRDAAGNVAAYALFWLDPLTQVGLIEPMRTESAFQRQGLARHLIAEGVTRLRALGAQSIRVVTFAKNTAANALYHRMGFVDRFKELEYRRNLPTVN